MLTRWKRNWVSSGLLFVIIIITIIMVNDSILIMSVTDGPRHKAAIVYTTQVCNAMYNSKNEHISK